MGRIALALLLLGCPAFAHSQADAERGRAIAVGGSGAPRSACHTCHGPNGEGDASGAFPRLTGQSTWYLYKQLKDYASGTRANEVMSPIAKTLADQDAQDVAAFYAAQTAAIPGGVREADPQLLQRGGAIAAQGLRGKGVEACVNCHGAAGEGMPPSSPALAGQFAPYTELQFRFWKEGQRRNSPLGVMEHIARQLSEDEVRALAAYFAALPLPNRQATSR
jgi:cytochrome c553